MPATRQLTDDLFQLCESGFERAVLRRLIDLGYQVTPQVKVGGYSIDLVVEGLEGRRLAVELDGNQYHTPERWPEDFKRQRVLERVGWTFWRCWGSSFTLDPDACMNDLTRRLNELGIEPTSGESVSNGYTKHLIVGPPEPPGEQPAVEPAGAVSKQTEESQMAAVATAFGLPSSKGPQAAFEFGLDEVTPKSSREMAESIANEELSGGDSLTIEPGDRVLISYNDEPSRQYTLTLSTTHHDPDHFVINHEMPLAKALIGWGEEDEVEIPAGNGARTVTILRIERTGNQSELSAQTYAADASNVKARRKAQS